MSRDDFSPDDPSPENFGGVVRLFPLPNLVLFPHVAQPLHIFEPRYRRLMADALAGDRLIAMALLRPGWEQEYHNRPPIHDVVCVGKIRQEEGLPDGRFNLLLQGLCRARIVEELDADTPYRVARVEVCPDEPVGPACEEEALRDRLSRGVMPFFSAHPAAADQLRGLVASPITLGALCDIFCFALSLDTEDKQRLLAEPDVERRILSLLGILDGKTPAAAPAPPRQRFPPEFSSN